MVEPTPTFPLQSIERVQKWLETTTPEIHLYLFHPGNDQQPKLRLFHKQHEKPSPAPGPLQNNLNIQAYTDLVDLIQASKSCTDHPPKHINAPSLHPKLSHKNEEVNSIPELWSAKTSICSLPSHNHCLTVQSDLHDRNTNETGPPLTATPSKKYARRKRHRTKPDKYEFKGDTERQHRPRSGQQRHQKVRSKRKKNAAYLNDDFEAANIDPQRLTLLRSNHRGLFGRGKMGVAFENCDLPDLTFPAISSLLQSKRHCDHKLHHKKVKRAKAKAAKAGDPDISEYFSNHGICHQSKKQNATPAPFLSSPTLEAYTRAALIGDQPGSWKRLEDIDENSSIHSVADLKALMDKSGFADARLVDVGVDFNFKNEPFELCSSAEKGIGPASSSLFSRSSEFRTASALFTPNFHRQRVANDSQLPQLGDYAADESHTVKTPVLQIGCHQKIKNDAKTCDGSSYDRPRSSSSRNLQGNPIIIVDEVNRTVDDCRTEGKTMSTASINGSYIPCCDPEDVQYDQSELLEIGQNAGSFIIDYELPGYVQASPSLTCSGLDFQKLKNSSYSHAPLSEKQYLSLSPSAKAVKASQWEHQQKILDQNSMSKEPHQRDRGYESSYLTHSFPHLTNTTESQLNIASSMIDDTVSEFAGFDRPYLLF